MTAPIRFVYFDIGGVLLRWQEFFETIAITYGKNRVDVEANYFRYDNLACRGEISTQDAWNRALRDLQVTPSADFDFATRWIETFTPIAESHTLLRTIAAHYPVGLLTNIHKETYELSLKKRLIPDLAYHTVVKSCDIGLVKPEKEIYEYAKQQAGVPHEAIFFTDDLEKNISTAQLLGWHTVQFAPDNPAHSVQQIKKVLKITQ